MAFFAALRLLLCSWPVIIPPPNPKAHYDSFEWKDLNISLCSSIFTDHWVACPCPLLPSPNVFWNNKPINNRPEIFNGTYYHGILLQIAAPLSLPSALNAGHTGCYIVVLVWLLGKLSQKWLTEWNVFILVFPPDNLRLHFFYRRISHALRIH